MYGDWSIWNFVLMAKISAHTSACTEKHRNAITINDFWKRDFLAMIFVRYFTDSKCGEGKMCQFPSEFALLVSIKRENWDFLKRKKNFFSYTRFYTQRKNANSKRNLYCNKQREEKYLTRFEVDIANEKRGWNWGEAKYPKRKTFFIEMFIWMKSVCTALFILP